MAENQPAGTLVGSPVTLTGLVGAVTYELGGSDADSFSIDSASGQLRTNGLLDFEEQRRYEVTVTINDDNGSAEVEVWINVTDLEEPGEMSAGPASLRAGTIIRARFTDPDGGVDPSLVIWRWAVSDDGMNFTRVAGGISGETPGKGAEAAAFTPAAEHAGKFLRVRVTYADRRSPNGSNLDKSAEWVSGTRIAPGSTPPALTVRPLLSGLTIPWDVAFTPDGTMLVTERGGRLLSRFPDGRVKEVSADFRDLYSNIYVGLMGLAVDPDFETNRRFYTCQAHTGVRVEVIAWTMADDYSTATRVADPLVGGIGFSQFPRHGGCRVLFGPDGFLWITTGDGDNHTAAQNLNSLNGKVLRVDSQTGQGAPDNPFNSRVYTYGHRNPQGLAFRPGTNQVWTVEHGPSHDDEINLLASGGNYGWDPAGPGYDENVPMTDLKAFPDAVEAKWHSGFPAIATSGAAFLDGSCWGEWNGRLAVAQLKQQELKVFEFTADGTLLSEILVPELDQVYGRLRSPVLGPDCALYVTTSNGSGTDHVLQVYGPSSPRLSGPSTVEYREGDTQPVATFTSHNLDGSVSWTLDGQDASAFRITASGELHFRTPPQFHASTDANSDNVYHAAVKADNGTSSAQIGVAVSVARTTTQEPEVSIAAGGGVTEGGDATFTVTADPAPSAALDVTVAITQTGDFGVSPGSHTVTIPTSGTVALTVSTTNDTADEADGSVTATVDAGAGYTVSSTASSAAVAVADDDDPPCDTADAIVRARAAFAWHTDNNGGSETLFWQILAYLGADSMPAPPGGIIPASTTPEAVRTFSDGRTWPGWVPINAAMTCHTPTTPSTAPEVSIAAGAGVAEGGDAVFTVSAVPVPAAALDVAVAVTAAGDFGVSPGSRTVAVPTTGTATLTVATINDSADEADGSVTATVGAGSGYTVSATAGSAAVAVSDDDDPPAVCVPSLPSDAVTVSEVTGWRNQYSHAEHQQRWDRVLAALGTDTGETAMTVADAQTVKAQIDNSRWDRTVRTLQALEQCDDPAPPPPPDPEVSVAAGADITEGGDAVFTVTASPAPSAALTVTVSVSQSGDFGITGGSRQVTIPSSGTATLTVATTNDSADEADGSVTATVGAGQGYTVSATSGSVAVAVADDDDPPPPPDPEVSVAAGADITEGGDAVFTVTASPAPSAALTVTVSVSQSGDFGITGGSRQVTIPSSGTATLTVATVNDSADEADGSVTATVGAGQGYTVSATAGSASVAVADDDDPPPPPVNATPSFSISDASGAEGGTLTFTVTLSPSSNRYAWVHYYARPAFGTAASATFADFAQTYGMLTFEPGDTTKTITVALIDDNTPEANETFKLVLYTPAQAKITDGEATGTITDND
ncbi:PQQ-dependent sugar dehydrogenase [Candidatus Poriferisocius sp.]|uniref:PQQ-dependent sugar dehydrogenase n=1 Tax=Candidatus Poriferisocius sp. TaxID=3101276 RepID=UPI003B5C8C3F